MKHAEGEPAPRGRHWFSREEIGPPDCPIMYRWTLVKLLGRKLMLHHFLPNADDRDVHDHPAGFVTIVLRGGYADMAPCVYCAGNGYHTLLSGRGTNPCEFCDGGVVLRERMTAGMIRYRSAEHAHRTKVGAKGCWTLVVMLKKSRPWGFLRAGRWWPWREYEQTFGFGMRCDDE